MLPRALFVKRAVSRSARYVAMEGVPMRKRLILTVLVTTMACGHEAEKAGGRAEQASRR